MLNSVTPFSVKNLRSKLLAYGRLRLCLSGAFLKVGRTGPLLFSI